MFSNAPKISPMVSSPLTWVTLYFPTMEYGGGLGNRGRSLEKAFMNANKRS